MRTRRLLSLAGLLATAFVAGSALSCGQASLTVYGPTGAPTPPCYAASPPNCTFSGDVIGVLGAPEPANLSVQCFEQNCHTGPSPAGLIALGPPNFVSPGAVWHLLTTSGGAVQRGGGGLDIVYSATNAAMAANSLFLEKPDADAPATSHGGGKIFSEASSQYKVILSWIQSGAKNN